MPSARKGRDLFAWFAALTIFNFVAFWWIAVLSGGDALNGKITGDQYFLGEHGRYTPVSHYFWLYSFSHASATLLSFAVMFVGMFMRLFNGKGNWYFRKKDEDLHPRGRGTV